MALDSLIAVDWGTSNARVFRLDATGSVIERRETDQGITNVPGKRFADALRNMAGDWIDSTPGVQVLMSGMIGSRQGWVEAPYADCPVSEDELTDKLVRVPEFDFVRIVPGVHYCSTNDRHDVIRGEEVQIFGALPEGDKGRRVFCLPGTHCKWALVEDGRCTWFATAVTGEVFRALEKHTILGALMSPSDTEAGEAGPAGFRSGLERAREDGGVLHHLFSTRADGLFSAIPAEGLRDYMSGILIGNEIRDMVAMTRATEVALVGAPAMNARYVEALKLWGVKPTPMDVDTVTVKGLVRIAKALGI